MIIDFDDLKQQLNSNVPGEAARAEQEAIVLAEDGSIDAAELLVGAYADGTAAIRADRIKEFKYTKMAAEMGSSFSRFWLAHLQRESGDHGSALENARVAHGMGEVGATNLLARMMLAGEGQPAKPLEALQLLSESVEGGTNTDAALLLAEVWLEGKHIPRNAQNAYDVLQRHAHFMSTATRRVAPQDWARALYLKAEAVKLGAVPVEGDSYAGLIEQAAEAGDPDAGAARSAQRNDAASRARDAEWDAICRFTAYRAKWEMFFKAARLLGSSNKSHTSVSGYNGSVSSHTSHWQVATFATASGNQFTVSLPARASLVRDREYAVLYIGPAGSERGTPTHIVDPADGSVVQANGDLVSSYPKHGSRLLSGVGKLLMAIGVLAVLALFGGLGFGALVLGVLAGVGGYKLYSGQSRGYKRALEDARRFFCKHGKPN